MHVAGTNGKGSTITFLSSILQKYGLTVGVFLSPHLVSYAERIQINNAFIPDADFLRLFNEISMVTDYQCTEFEILTLIAFCYFNEAHPDIVILETGLGGRLDATNVVDPDLCIITSIGLDHQQILGDTLPKIAAEKAGIVKPGKPLITTTTQQADVMSVFKDVCAAQEAELYCVEPVQELPKAASLQGYYQCINAGLAQYAANLLYPDIDAAVIKSGLIAASHWGRYTIIKHSQQTVIIDAAHNEQGMHELINNLNQDFGDCKKTFLIGFNKTKDIMSLVHRIEAVADDIYYCQFDNEFSVSFNDVKGLFVQPIKPFEVGDSLPGGELIVITGSIYFLGKIQEQFRTQKPTLIT
ncbi:hypothetical protein DID76_04670 [Candidatus Marinamargulisbacteria bacterium SCGC AG-414-C22]|nr:hypothetical protein DID76_04670 [Candidatus Marinamargulisbacteria bacterium SCGC AG-414-C22]